MLLKIQFIWGDMQSRNIRHRYRERVCEKSPKLTLCVSRRTERKLLNVCLRERERKINWVSGEKLSAESASIKPRRRPPIRRQKERKKRDENNDRAKEQKGSAVSLS